MYKDLIKRVTGATDDDVQHIEAIMRRYIFHSTLDWQTKKQIVIAAKEAMKILKVLQRYHGVQI